MPSTHAGPLRIFAQAMRGGDKGGGESAEAREARRGRRSAAIGSKSSRAPPKALWPQRQRAHLKMISNRYPCSTSNPFERQVITTCANSHPIGCAGVAAVGRYSTHGSNLSGPNQGLKGGPHRRGARGRRVHDVGHGPEKSSPSAEAAPRDHGFVGRRRNGDRPLGPPFRDQGGGATSPTRNGFAPPFGKSGNQL